jgi:ABC-type amino acid transport substrate-binding protein
MRKTLMLTFIPITGLALVLSGPRLAGPLNTTLAQAQTEPVATNNQNGASQASALKLNVGTKAAPPFVIKHADGSFSGISINLWEQIADRLQIDYTIKAYDLQGLLQAVKQKDIDVAAAALTITPQREAYLDFSHAFYVDGLGIAVPQSNDKNWIIALKRFISWEFLSVILVLGLVLLIFGCLAWFFERKHNRDEFHDDAVKGIGDGFWWSAVTMTTVGYGDKSPRSLGGRVIALVWMFTSVIIISSFTAAITSAVTVSQLGTSIQGPQDLVDVKVGTVTDSSSAQVLDQRAVHYMDYPSLEDCLRQLKNGRLDAVVYDAALLRYQIKENFADALRVLPHTFTDQAYGLAFPSQHPTREIINQALLTITNSPAWQDTLDAYLGQE